MDLHPLQEFLGQIPEAISDVYSPALAFDDPGEDLNLMRLMEPAEAVQETLALRSSWLQLNSDLLVLWTDDNSNYAAVFMRGDLAPRVALLDHDETEYTPCFFSPVSFEAAQRRGAKGEKAWCELTQDYPVTSPEDYPLLDLDRALGLKYLAEYLAHPKDEHRQLAFHAMNLLPFSEAHRIGPLLRSNDMWVQERACRTLGKRRYEPAIDALYQIALRSSHNGEIAAILALQQMESTKARDLVANLKKVKGKGYAPYFR